MPETQTFWSVECPEGEPDFFVCMSCLNEVYRCKVPIACPSCGAISTFEAFTLDSIQDWGTEELIAKARQDSSEAPVRPPLPTEPKESEPPSLAESSSV